MQKAKPPEHNDPAAVNDFLASSAHPLKPLLEAIRECILGADEQITEGIKWKSPSFYCQGWFATINLRAANQIIVVLHHGAKLRSDSDISVTIKDPKKLLTWPSQDRALSTFVSMSDFKIKRSAFANLIRQWAAYQLRQSSSL